MTNVINLKRTLYPFEIASGLKINYHKLSLIGISISNLDIQDYCSLMGYRATSLPKDGSRKFM